MNQDELNQIRDEYYARQNEFVRNYLETIFNRVFLNPRNCKSAYTDNDYARACSYVAGAKDVLLKGYDTVFEYYQSRLSDKLVNADFTEASLYLDTLNNQWMDIFITTYTNVDTSSGRWVPEDALRAEAYANGAIYFQDYLNEIAPKENKVILEGLGL